MIVAITKNLKNLLHWNARVSQNLISYCTNEKNENKEKPEIPKNELEGVFSAQSQENGECYDKKPFKMRLEAGKLYSWCLCGQSHGQPLCDRTHQNIFLKIKLRPIFFKVKKTKEYWLCNCKQTSNRPFCDGTHLRPDIQERRYK